MHEINIYGDIVPFKWYNDGSEFDLNSLNSIIKDIDFKEGDELVVNINTFGGDTTTAFAIYNKLLRLKADNNINVTTRIDGYCASAGVILLLAGDKRVGNSYAEPFVHNAWTFAVGNAKEMEKINEDLNKVDNQIANLYAERTNITSEKALELMNADTSISPDECLIYGFYTELENVFTNNQIFNSIKHNNKRIKINNNNMVNKNEKATILNKILDIFKNDSGVKNLEVYTSTNEILDFYDLTDTDNVKIGDKANFNDKPANGDYTISNGDTYTFANGVLDAITENGEEIENIDDLKQEIASLKEQLKNQNTENLKAINEIKDSIKENTEIFNKLKGIVSDVVIEEENEEKNNGKKTTEQQRIENANNFKLIK